MEQVQWECAICGNVNNEEIECFIEKDYLIKNFNCKECEEEHFALLEYKPKIVSIDLV